MPTSPPADEAPSIKLEADRAYLDLRDRIVTLRLAPGTVLREDELMRELVVGRTPLREAVKRLALENLVAVQPRRGTFVSAVEAADIVNITEVRAELEGYAAELAATATGRRPSRAAAEALLREVERAGAPGDQDWLMRFDERIHRFTWEAAGNPYLHRDARALLHPLAAHLVPGARPPARARPRRARSDAIWSRRCSPATPPSARSIMREHVLDFQRELLAAFSRT